MFFAWRMQVFLDAFEYAFVDASVSASCRQMGCVLPSAFCAATLFSAMVTSR
jgi:hypothetical protein